MASIHFHHHTDLHKTKPKQVNQVDVNVEKNLQFQGAEFDQLLKTSVNNNNSHDPDSRHSAQQRSLNRYALRRQRIMQNPVQTQEEQELQTDFQSHLQHEPAPHEISVEEKEKEKENHTQHHAHKNEHLTKNKTYQERTDKNNNNPSFFTMMGFESLEINLTNETRETYSPSDIAMAWEEVISAVRTNISNSQTSVLITLQSPVFLGSQIQITQITDQLLVELLLINDQSMEMARSQLQELEINLKKRLNCNVKVSLQRRNEDGSTDHSATSHLDQNVNESKDLWGDDSVDIEELIM